jgi:hypothetical protein
VGIGHLPSKNNVALSLFDLEDFFNEVQKVKKVEVCCNGEIVSSI